MANIYAVEVVVNGKLEVSRFFTRIIPARKWAKWLKSASYIQSVRILKGGQGDQVVS